MLSKQKKVLGIMQQLHYHVGALSPETGRFKYTVKVLVRIFEVMPVGITAWVKNVVDVEFHCTAVQWSFETFGHQLPKTFEIGSGRPTLDLRTAMH